MILFEVESTINDDCKIFYEGNEVVILAWFLTLGLSHYCWLRDPINQLFSNRMTEHLVLIIQHMLEFLLL
jgi:hypothetical protein